MGSILNIWIQNSHHSSTLLHFKTDSAMLTQQVQVLLSIFWWRSHGNTTKCSIELPKLNIYENSWTSWYLLKLTIIMVDQETLSTCTFGKITRPDRKVILNIISHIYLTMCDIMIYHLRYRLKLRVNYKVLLISEKCIKWGESQNLKKG